MAAPRKDDTKTHILESTEALLKSREAGDISLADIARKAKISKGTLYYHFPSKDAILLGLMDKYLHTQWEQFKQWIGNESKDTSLHRFIMYILERDTMDISIRIHILMEAIRGNEVLKKELLSRYKNFANAIAKQIPGRARHLDPDYLAWFLLVLSDGLLLHETLGNPDLDTDRFITQTAAYVKTFMKQED